MSEKNRKITITKTARDFAKLLFGDITRIPMVGQGGKMLFLDAAELRFLEAMCMIQDGYTQDFRPHSDKPKTPKKEEPKKIGSGGDVPVPF